MIDSLLGILSAGLLFELPSEIAPGPVLVLVISEILGYIIRSGTKVACISLLTDAPVVLASAFLFTQISKMDNLLGVISLVGWVFLLYLGTKNIRIVKRRNTVLFEPETLLFFEVVLVFSGLLFGLLILML